MKKILPLLICYVLTQGQCFAISGGPVYGGSGHVGTVGSYSGIIQGVTETDPTSTGAPAIPGDTVPGGETSTTSSNALGLFDLIVPGTTTATGGFLLFADGIVFGGTISASVDPDSDRLSGILQGGFSVTESTSGSGTTITSTTNSFDATAVGIVTAKIGAAGSRSATAARLTGTASMDIDFGQINSDLSPVVNRIINFTVTGFQTTTSTATSSTIGTAGSSGTSSAGG